MIRFTVYTAIFIILAICIGNLNAAGKKAATAAVPRSKAKGESVVSRVFGQGIFHRAIREMKISFCSELEAVTLQVMILECSETEVRFDAVIHQY